MISKNATNHGFTCMHCRAVVAPAPRTARNHCPHCLYSLHVDAAIPGDRESTCGGSMQPIRAYQKKGDIWGVIHRCTLCGKEQPNTLADDDDFDRLVALSDTKK